MTVPGCGWTAEGTYHADGPYADVPCVARDGARKHGARSTVGAVGLCMGCLGDPGELLHELSKAYLEVTGAGNDDVD